jgi:hypothetical protein
VFLGQHWLTRQQQTKDQTMLTKTQIQVASSALYILEQEGATFAPVCTPSRGFTARETCEELLAPDAECDSIVVEFREEAVSFTIEFSTLELSGQPADCIDRAMMVRRALLNMSSN